MNELKAKLWYFVNEWNVCKCPYNKSITRAIYEVGVSYNVTDKIKISASHTCYHPIITDDGKSRSGMFGGGDVITISYGY